MGGKSYYHDKRILSRDNLIKRRKKVTEISIKEARERKGLSQAELAEKLGVHQTSIAAWENSKWGPVARRLPDMAKILDCSIEELLTGNTHRKAV